MNCKTGFVLYSTGTEVVQESCIKICFIIVGTSENEKKKNKKKKPTSQNQTTTHQNLSS